MRRFAPVLAILLIAAATAAPAGAAKHQTQYYLGLGDSLAAGQQPNALGDTIITNQGYVNQLYATARKQIKGLKLIDYGCPSETTTTLVNGGHCRYTGGTDLARGKSQLQTAVRFLKKYGKHVAFVTLDVGANDIQRCVKNGQIVVACLNGGINAIKTNVPKIAKALRKAAGKKIPIAGMTYYDPFLESWLAGTDDGRNLAKASVTLAKNINGTLATDYKNQKFVVADVAAAFKTEDFDDQATFNGQQVPLNVERICTLTWMCAPQPIGTNIHARKTGYALIAQTFADALGF